MHARTMTPNQAKNIAIAYVGRWRQSFLDFLPRHMRGSFNLTAGSQGKQ